METAPTLRKQGHARRLLDALEHPAGFPDRRPVYPEAYSKDNTEFSDISELWDHLGSRPCVKVTQGDKTKWEGPDKLDVKLRFEKKSKTCWWRQKDFPRNSAAGRVRAQRAPRASPAPRVPRVPQALVTKRPAAKGQKPKRRRSKGREDSLFPTSNGVEVGAAQAMAQVQKGNVDSGLGSSDDSEDRVGQDEEAVVGEQLDFEEEREVEKEQRMTIMIASSEKVQTTADRKTLPEWRQSYGGGVCTARPRMARSMGCSCCILTCCCA